MRSGSSGRTAVTVAEVDRGASARARNARIRELRGQGWSHVAIAREFDLSHVRVGQILAEPDPDEILEERERELRVELAYLAPIVGTLFAHLARQRAVKGELLRIARIRASNRLNRDLGLPPEF